MDCESVTIKAFLQRIFEKIRFYFLGGRSIIGAFPTVLLDVIPHRCGEQCERRKSLLAAVLTSVAM